MTRHALSRPLSPRPGIGHAKGWLRVVATADQSLSEVVVNDSSAKQVPVTEPAVHGVAAKCIPVSI